MKNQKIYELLVGDENTSSKSIEPFSQVVCNFLSDLSEDLKKNQYYKVYPDIAALAFWLRKKNILKTKNYFQDSNLRLGLGLLFHITPSNVATNFAYSLVFGLITGNSNVVKVPSKNFYQVEIICKSINKVLKKYKELKEMIKIIRYSDYDNITKKYSSLCDGRLIWGGDKTIQDIRCFSTHSRSVDITFADRYSFCVIDIDKLKKLTLENLKKIVYKFYNDTYLVDQNACSSPHLIIWYGTNNKGTKKKFWQILFELVKKKYEISEQASIDKLTKLHSDILDYNNIKNYQNFRSDLYVLNLKNLDSNNHKMRGKWGFFYEYETRNLNAIAKFINKKYQTLTYFGLEKSILTNFVIKNNLKGVDRIVPIGQSQDINFFWDGYDINKILTRVIDIQ